MRGSLEQRTSAADDVICVRNERHFQSNSYVVRTATAGRCILVDPGLDGEAVDAVLVSNGLEPLAVFCTHGHFDHLGSVSLFQTKYGIQAHLHGDDIKVSRSSNFLLMACKIDHRINVPQIDCLLSDGMEVAIDGVTVRYHHTPGHTPGSGFLEIGEHVFTGDTMYRNAIGLVDLPGEDKDMLRRSLIKMWDLLPGTSIIHPGHGGSDRFEKIKAENRPLRAFLGFPEGATA